MMSIEIRVCSGQLIGHVYVRNIEPVDVIKDAYLYEVKYYAPERKPALMEFIVKHNREEGSEKLAEIIFKEINRRLKGSGENRRKK